MEHCYEMISFCIFCLSAHVVYFVSSQAAAGDKHEQIKQQDEQNPTLARHRDFSALSKKSGEGEI